MFFNQNKMLKFLIKYIIALSISIYVFGNAVIGGTSTKNIVASRMFQSPKIDGILSEGVWKLAVPVTGFQQFDPDEGTHATELTTVKILYDDDALYVGVVCYDSEPDKIVNQLTRRDRSVQSDRFSVMIDSYHDYTTAFLFCGSVSGVKSDGVLSQDGLVYDVQWDAVWDFNAKIFPDGWSAEFRIPYSAIRFADQEDEYVWGINFRRYIARKQETDEWVMVPRREAPPGTISSVSKMGTLSGIINIHPPLHVELLPYHVSKVNFLSQPSPFPLKKEYQPNVGIDAKYGLTNNFTLDLAVNPDYGQVEVDQAKLNLTVFEIYYPEKRPFFLEGSQIFSFGNSFDNKQLRLFYSRRIGRQPRGYDYITLDSSETFSEKPEVTTILAAGKLSGCTSDGLEIGVFTAITDREEAVIKRINGTLSPRLMVEPQASYSVARFRKKILENSSFGIMATTSLKQHNFPSFSGGLDWNIRTKDGMYGCDAYIAGSLNKFDPVEHVTGSTGRIAFGKLGGEHWLTFSAYDFSTQKFSINDIGFYSQPREHGGYTAISYKEDHADAPIRRYALTAQTQYRWNWDGNNTLNNFEIEPSIEFRNFWQMAFDYIYDFPANDDANRWMIGLYRRPSANNLSITIRTDSRQMIEATLQAGFAGSAKRANTSFAYVQATIRPIGWMEFNTSYSIVKTRHEEAWVTTPNPPYYYYVDERYNLFGDRNIDQHDLSLRGTLTFTRDLSLQFFTQVFLAKGRYTNFKKLIGRDNLSSYDFGSPDLDFNEKTLNANIVLRWEYLPGSTFYLVWTQGRHGYRGTYGQTFLHDAGDVFLLPMDNVILAKISYWWSF
jgi:hypothetical protein